MGGQMDGQMHGFNCSMIDSFPLVCPPAAVAPGCLVNPIAGMRNLLPIADLSQTFGHNIAPARLRELMRKLAARTAREPDWPDRLPSAAANEDNPTIPSGYTYLLQLIAHDMVNTSISLAVAGGRKFGFENSRVLPLTLETVFGGGPDVCPQAYEFSQVCSNYRGSVPRTRLRVGRTQQMVTKAKGPFDDIGRTTPVDVRDDGIPPEAKPPLLTEALVADPRNDDHALISQLTVLFHRLHNLIIGMIEDTPATSTLDAYRNFVCARLITTLIYRRIIVFDVLQRLLDPSAFRYYVLDNKPLVAPDKGVPVEGVPVEFSHGAFRCGHAMVRKSYRVNSDVEQDTVRALQLSSSRSPEFLPVTDVWTVKWEYFFELNKTVPNHSRRVGPNYSAATKSEWYFPPILPNTGGQGDAPGLPSRDFLSSMYAQLWSVPLLIDELRKTPEIAAFLPAYSCLQQPLTDWLNAPAGPYQISEHFEPGDVAILAADPPLPFFVLFEAAYTRNSTTSPFRGGGQHLGPLGSIIVAEAIMGAIKQSDIRAGGISFSPCTDLTHQIEGACVHLKVDKSKLASVPDIRDMPGLLKFMRQRGVLPP